MNCADAARVLNGLQLGMTAEGAPALSDADASFVQALVRVGDAEALDGLEAADDALELRRHDLDALRSAYEAGTLTFEAFREKESRLRSEILELVERDARRRGGAMVGGRRYALSYKGRNLLSTLLPRLARVESLDLGDFEREMEGLRGSLASRASKSAEIFRALAGDLRGVDAVHLRNAAVGLSARIEPARELARTFALVFGQLGASGIPAGRHALLAEVLVVTRGPLEPRGAEAEVRQLISLVDAVRVEFASGADFQDTVEAAAMLYTLPPGLRQDALLAAGAFRRAIAEAGSRPLTTVAPWVLIGCSGLGVRPGAGDWVRQLREELSVRAAPPQDAEMAAAILGASRGEAGAELLYQFDTARAYLSRLSEESFVVPAAMLAALPTSISETLDDLRMAAAEVSGKGLSTGGLENLSLAIKILMQTAVIAGGSSEGLSVGPVPQEALAPLGLAGLALILPTALVAVYAFHEVSVHQAAVQAYRFHPVHTHYIYG